jgi:hypothetical protein
MAPLQKIINLIAPKFVELLNAGLHGIHLHGSSTQNESNFDWEKILKV